MQKTAYEVRIRDWSSDVCASDLSSADFRRKLRIRCLVIASATGGFCKSRVVCLPVSGLAKWSRTRTSRLVEAAMQEHLYIVAYDISDDKRLRKVFKLMKGYGEWLQF